MKVTFVHDDQRHAATVPHAGTDHATIKACPTCNATPCNVRGAGVTHHDHDTYYSPARTLCCNAAGQLEAKMSTIFGIEEDEAVLRHGRLRVYA